MDLFLVFLVQSHNSTFQSLSKFNTTRNMNLKYCVNMIHHDWKDITRILFSTLIQLMWNHKMNKRNYNYTKRERDNYTKREREREREDYCLPHCFLIPRKCTWEMWNSKYTYIACMMSGFDGENVVKRQVKVKDKI